MRSRQFILEKKLWKEEGRGDEVCAVGVIELVGRPEPEKGGQAYMKKLSLNVKPPSPANTKPEGNITTAL